MKIAARSLCGTHIGWTVQFPAQPRKIVMIMHKKNGTVVVRGRYEAPYGGVTHDHSFKADAEVEVEPA